MSNAQPTRPETPPNVPDKLETLPRQMRGLLGGILGFVAVRIQSNGNRWRLELRRLPRASRRRPRRPVHVPAPNFVHFRHARVSKHRRQTGTPGAFGGAVRLQPA